MNGENATVLEPRRLETCSRSDKLEFLRNGEYNHRRMIESPDSIVGMKYPDPKVVEVGTLCHGTPNRGEEQIVLEPQPSTPNCVMEENSIILTLSCD